MRNASGDTGTADEIAEETGSGPAPGPAGDGAEPGSGAVFSRPASGARRAGRPRASGGGRRRRRRAPRTAQPAPFRPRTLSIIVAVALLAGVTGLVVGLQTNSGSNDLNVTEAGRSGGPASVISLWGSSARLPVQTSPDTRRVVLGLRFRAETSGEVSALRVFRPGAGGGPNTGALWSADGRLLSTLTIPDSDRGGWRRGAFGRPVALQAGRTYVAAYQVETGGYVDQVNYFANGQVRKVGPLVALAGVYTYRASAFPNETWEASNYYVDVEFRPGSRPSGAPVTAPPSPGPNATAPPSSPAPSGTAGPGATPQPPAPTAPATGNPAPGATNPGVPPPSSGGGAATRDWPGAHNTGVRAGVTLTPSRSITVTEDNTVISNLDVKGTIKVRARNVTIRNVRVHGCGEGGAIDTGYMQDRTGPTLIEDVEVSGDGLSCDRSGIGNSNMTIRRANIHGFRAGIYSDGSTVVEGSWVHDLYSNQSSHMDGFLSNGGSNLTLIGNTIECAVPDGNDYCTGSIGLFGDFAPIQNVLIQRNLFNTQGSYCVYGGSGDQKPFPVAKNVRILDNTFGRRYHAACGTYGTIAGFVRGNGNEVAGNVWAETGAPVTL
ncbi:DUF4082 domain-containing protein [Parafrankia sp. FMc2]|uniref:DUF4082 domain-containing protein n=1 Tax=Parafrankia sp. FMc2 TaxID=3233196 RepID=UPI0034D396F5